MHQCHYCYPLYLPLQLHHQSPGHRQLRQPHGEQGEGRDHLPAVPPGHAPPYEDLGLHVGGGAAYGDGLDDAAQLEHQGLVVGTPVEVAGGGAGPALPRGNVILHLHGDDRDLPVTQGGGERGRVFTVLRRRLPPARRLAHSRLHLHFTLDHGVGGVKHGVVLGRGPLGVGFQMGFSSGSGRGLGLELGQLLLQFEKGSQLRTAVLYHWSCQGHAATNVQQVLHAKDEKKAVCDNAVQDIFAREGTQS